MKNVYFILPTILLSAVTLFSQDRPRYYDNFDTARGVQVQTPPPTAAQSRSAPAKPGKLAPRGHYIPSPPTGDAYKNRAPAGDVPANPYVIKTAKVLMSPPEGYSTQFSQPSNASRSSMMAPSAGMRGYSTGDAVVDSYIVDSSRRYGIDPLLIYSQMHQESSFHPHAMSPKGATGLMQLMPATARRLGVADINDPKQNIDGGVKYMRMLLDMFDGNLDLALAGYNAGEAAVIKYGNQIPPYAETQDYVRRISSLYSSISYTRIARK